MRKPVIAANWKMYKTPAQAQEFLQAFLPLVANHKRDEILLFPSYVDLSVAIAATKGSNVSVGAQNMHYAEEGAYTGEISPSMIKALGATHVLLGHSERREYFGETDEIINKKLHAALHHGLTPVLCMGETLEERDAGKTEEVLLRHCQEALKGVVPHAAESFIIAYEPIWAIGTGKTATPEIAGLAHFHIRTQVAHLLGRQTADRIRILYGGSVKPENACALLNQPEVDGALVGGASLDPQSFAKIVKY
ncbi:triose-phosphate isomerase [Silvibacterium sp.]|uniref:triose-phosphate isomerase n=1 Tax=Silvibacterium sp. TaxID=1964179 RepID=UPI0039E2F962